MVNTLFYVGNNGPKGQRLALILYKHYPTVKRLWLVQEEYRRLTGLCAPQRATAVNLARIAERLEEGYTVKDCLHALRVFWGRAKRKKSVRFFNGVNNWYKKTLALALAEPLPLRRS